VNDDEFVYGIHAVTAALKMNTGGVNEVWLVDRAGKNKRLSDIAALAKQVHVPVKLVSHNELEMHADGIRHQGVIASLKQASSISSIGEAELAGFLDGLEQAPFLLVLDGIQDPHNLGACIRAANAAGMHAVIAPKDRAVGITPVVRKVASGAVEAIPFVKVTNLARVLQKLKDAGIWIVGADEQGDTTLFDSDLSGPIALVLGAEGKGLRRLTREHCDFIVNIPMMGTVESLNVSVAAGVLIYEAMRQRMK